MRPWGWMAVMCVMAAGSARAAPSEGLRDLCPDRPGKGTPPCILDTSHWQLEIGLADFQHDREAGVSTDGWALGAVEARLGLTQTLEAEVGWTAYTTVRTHDAVAGVTHDSGVGDLTFSLRQSLARPDGGGVSVALEPFVTASTGAAGIGAGEWEGGLIIPSAAALPDGFGLGLSPQVHSAPNQSGVGRHAAYAGVVGLSHALGPLSAGVELWGEVDDDPAGRTTQMSLDLTAAYVAQALPEVQFDGGLYLGLNRHTPDVEIAVGVARRF